MQGDRFDYALVIFTNKAKFCFLKHDGIRFDVSGGQETKVWLEKFEEISKE